MNLDLDTARTLAVALGCGLLVGLERERRKGHGPNREVAGLRSFAVAALAGALVALLGGGALLAAGLLGMALLLAATRRARTARDPGVTTELALLAVFLIGAWAHGEPVWAAVATVLLTGLLAARERLHHFALHWLREEELHDALLLAALALLVLPLLPATPWPWLGDLSARQLGLLVLALLVLQALAHFGLRLLGVRAGLLLSGLLGGLVSSTATVAALGARARREPAAWRACAAAAVMSTAATWLQTLLMLWPLAPQAARAWTPTALTGLGLSLLAAFVLQRGAAEALPANEARRPLRPREALQLAALLAAVSAGLAFAQQWLGAQGLLAAAFVAGLSDAHAALPSLAALAREGHIAPALLVQGVLLALLANSLMRSGVAWVSGGRRYAVAVASALLLAGLGAGLQSLAR